MQIETAIAMMEKIGDVRNDNPFYSVCRDGYILSVCDCDGDIDHPSVEPSTHVDSVTLKWDGPIKQTFEDMLKHTGRFCDGFGIVADAPTDPGFDYSGCSICHKHNGHLNIYKDSWIVCHDHQEKWWAGWGAFPTDGETDDDWETNAALLSTYEQSNAQDPFRMNFGEKPAYCEL